MARSRRLDALRADAYKRADVESSDNRHPAADVTRYLNQGGAALRDLIMDVRGREFFRKLTPQTITTTANTTNYALSSDFYLLLSVRRVNNGGEMLEPFSVMEEAELRDPANVQAFPCFYELRQATIELLPLHSAGTTIIVDYVPTFTDLVADSDVLEGFDGWEDYVVDYAARRMLVKDEELAHAAAVERDMVVTAQRIQALAPKRDLFRARRVRDVRGQKMRLGGRRW